MWEEPHTWSSGEFVKLHGKVYTVFRGGVRDFVELADERYRLITLNSDQILAEMELPTPAEANAYHVNSRRSASYAARVRAITNACDAMLPARIVQEELIDFFAQVESLWFEGHRARACVRAAAAILFAIWNSIEYAIGETHRRGKRRSAPPE